MQVAPIADNLQAIAAREQALHECRLAHLRERARLLNAEFAAQPLFFLEESFRVRYREEGERPEPTLTGVPREHVEDVRRLWRAQGAQDAAYFCRALLAYYRATHGADSVSPVSFCAPSAAEQLPFETDRIAYLKNAFADRAYEQFAKILPDAVVSYCEDFTGVCEEVTSGRARYGILPLENSTDGRLKAFHTLLRRYDLKTVLVCDVPVGDGVTQFALLGRRVASLDCGEHRAATFLEVRLSLSRTEALSQLLGAAAYYGLRLLRSSSAEGEGGNAFDLLFATEAADVSAYLCYLTLEFPRFIPLGIYTKLKE